MLNIKVVFVSPMRSALETAYILFKDHPNFNSIKFIMLPHLRPPLDCPANIPIEICETVYEYK